MPSISACWVTTLVVMFFALAPVSGAHDTTECEATCGVNQDACYEVCAGADDEAVCFEQCAANTDACNDACDQSG